MTVCESQTSIFKNSPFFKKISVLAMATLFYFLLLTARRSLVKFSMGCFV